MIEAWFITSLFGLGLGEGFNCIFPRIEEDYDSEGFVCQWEKSDFNYDAETDEYTLKEYDADDNCIEAAVRKRKN